MKLKSPFKLEQQDSVTREEKSNNTENPSKISSSVVVGLRIVTDTSLGNSNVVFKPAFKISLSDFRNNDRRRIGSRSPPTDETCFLKSCHLCRKKLSLDKEVYMYRGDQGFCSRDCRERQIVLDEMREFELSTKRMLKSLRHRSADATSADTRFVSSWRIFAGETNHFIKIKTTGQLSHRYRRRKVSLILV